MHDIRFKIFARIRIQLFDLMQKQIHVATNIRKTFSEFHIQANIRLQIFAYKKILACKYLHTSKYSLHIAIASNYIGRPSQGDRVKTMAQKIENFRFA
jgi:hypothetical protein